MGSHSLRLMSLVTLTALSVATAALADDKDKAESSKPSSTVILKTSTTGDGVPLVYPNGTPLITSRITVFPPHSKTNEHRHPVPLYAYVLEGELTIITEGQPPRLYKAGEAFMETAGWHHGSNDGDVPVRLLAVYAGQVDLPLSEAKSNTVAERH